MIFKRILVGALAASLLSSTALAHTNSVGYVGDGQGNITVWYGSWHDNTQFNEAELKVVDSNSVKLDQKAFDLLSQDSPAGLISGVNYFGSDMTQLVPYDPTRVSGMPAESYTWQGATFTLAPGDYTFVYIPLGDAESTLPGSPTQEWVPMDEVIRSLSITLTQGDIDGDANNNGILDVNEVAVGAASGTPSGPTVVGQGSSQVIGYVAATGGIIQIISRTQTDTTWDNMSDGTTSNTQVTNTTLTPFEGRVDQIASATTVIDHTTRGLTYDSVYGVRNNHSLDNGMSGRTTGSILGGTVTTDSGNQIYGGMVRLNTDLDGNDDSIDASTTGLGFGFVSNFEFGSIGVGLKHHKLDLDYTRTNGDFSNAGETTGSERIASIVYQGNGETFSPIVGYTIGKRSLNGYTETGSVQSALTRADQNTTYRYATVGGELSLGALDVTALRHTDGVNRIGIGIGNETESFVYSVNVDRTLSDLSNSTGISAGIRFNF